LPSHLCSIEFDDMAREREILKRVFGYSEFRGKQEEIIHHVLKGQDALAIMPTGAGKSLCYQLPALVFDGISVVISPLIALMKDQVDALRDQGVNARSYHSNMSEAEKQATMSDFHNGSLKLLYLSPERLFLSSAPFVNELKKRPLSLIAIDEAHCISHWGHDFREDYLSLGQLRQHFPKTPIIALTATADIRTRADILTRLGLPKSNVFLSSFNRPNLFYKALQRSNFIQQLDMYLQSRKEETGIVYCFSRKETDQTAQALQQLGYNALSYHAGLDKNQRTLRQDQFKKDEIKIMVATIAFGMGVDKPNVRYVVHAHLPKNMESYYQETGRAGRDGMPSDLLLLYSSGDLNRLRYFIYNGEDKSHQDQMLKKLNEMAAFAETSECRRKLILNYFDEKAPENCGHCDNCLMAATPHHEENEQDLKQLLQAIAIMRVKCTKATLFAFVTDRNSLRLPGSLQLHPLKGFGREHDKEYWEKQLDALVQKQLVSEYRGDIRLTHLGVQWKQGMDATFKQVESTSRASNYSEESNNELESELKAWRKELAKSEDLPAYIIFNDATLKELVEKRPYTSHSLLQITGLGEVKVEKYGAAILRIIRKASQDQIVESAKEGLIKARNSAKAPESFRLFKTGLNPDEIAQQTGLKSATIFKHLEGFVYDGSIDPDELVDSEHYRIINEIIDEIGAGMLSDIKDRAPEHIDYREIALVRAYKFRQVEELARRSDQEEWARRNAEKEWARRNEEEDSN